MSVSISNSLQQDLCLLTYKGNDIQIPQNGQLNLFMGNGEGIASMCSRLIQERVVDSKLLPADCIKKAMLCSQSITCSIIGQIYQCFQALQAIHSILIPATRLEASLIAKTYINLLTL